MSYLYAAFGIVWVVFIIYILNLVRQRRALNKELEVLNKIE
jgi:CcmD family protein